MHGINQHIVQSIDLVSYKGGAAQKLEKNETGKTHCAGAGAVRICSTSHVSVVCGGCCH